MHAVGRLFPRSDRAPAIEPVGAEALGRRIARDAALADWKTARTRRIASGFYKSQALEVIRA
jgi:magnesium-protoporphyrin O-methyltransferase